MRKLLLATLLIVLPAAAQKYEFGLHGSGSIYQSKTIKHPSGDVDAGFKMGFGGGFTLGHNQYDRIGGEVRYNYLLNKMKLSRAGTRAEFDGETHSIHYDLLFHFADRESRVRPYVSGGAGIRSYRGTGTEAAFQPLGTVAVLTKTSETQALVSLGGGIKFKLSDRIMFRVDVRDYLTPFPKEVITPVGGATVGGWINNIVPSAGISFTF